MKRENRIRGMLVCLALLFVGFTIFEATAQKELGLMIIMFSAGYALRETLERSETE